jgi:hypothetical protein
MSIITGRTFLSLVIVSSTERNISLDTLFQIVEEVQVWARDALPQIIMIRSTVEFTSDFRDTIIVLVQSTQQNQ